MVLDAGHVHYCCDSCTNHDKIGVKKKRKKNTYFIWFSNVPTSTGMTAQTFHYNKIRLHRRVFIIILDMIKL